jgi:hypothetical protein
MHAVQASGAEPEYGSIARSLQEHMTEMHYDPGQDFFEVGPVMLIFGSPFVAPALLQPLACLRMVSPSLLPHHL